MFKWHCVASVISPSKTPTFVGLAPAKLSSLRDPLRKVLSGWSVASLLTVLTVLDLERDMGVSMLERAGGMRACPLPLPAHGHAHEAPSLVWPCTFHCLASGVMEESPLPSLLLTEPQWDEPKCVCQSGGPGRVPAALLPGKQVWICGLFSSC